MSVAPVYAPPVFRVSVPLPVLVMPPVPVSREAKVTSLPLVSNVPPLPPIAASWPEISVVLPGAHCSPPPFSVMVPLPKLLAALKSISSPEIVVPPV
jgi:hypothetical protein